MTATIFGLQLWSMSSAYYQIFFISVHMCRIFLLTARFAQLACKSNFYTGFSPVIQSYWQLHISNHAGTRIRVAMRETSLILSRVNACFPVLFSAWQMDFFSHKAWTHKSGPF